VCQDPLFADFLLAYMEREGSPTLPAVPGVVDRLRDRVMAAAARQKDDPLAFIRDRDLFGGLADHERFTAAYTAALDALHTQGARATLESRASLDRPATA
jgi:mannitol 2-dehydrogenase